MKNLLVFEAGLLLSMPAIVIGALRGIKNEHNENELLSITSETGEKCQVIGSKH